jgi:hypothetical protein
MSAETILSCYYAGNVRGVSDVIFGGSEDGWFRNSEFCYMLDRLARLLLPAPKPAIRNVYLQAVAAVFLFLFATCAAWAQNPPADRSENTPPSQADSQTKPGGAEPQNSNKPAGSPQPQTGSSPSSTQSQQNGSGDNQQTNRILWVMPNYRAVSPDTQLPPLSVKEKFVLATHDSLDYTSGLFAGFLAGYEYAEHEYPEFHAEYGGYARYLWRAFADQAVGNYFTEAIVPAFTREDPRYYTLGHGGVWHRTEYALTRLVVTKTDSGKTRFNISEILGNGMGASVSDLYYPAQERTFRKTTENWGTQVAADGIANVVKEFWPDVRRRLLKHK